MTTFLVVLPAAFLTACAAGGTHHLAASAADARGAHTSPTTTLSRTSVPQPADHHQGSLTARERSLAAAIAQREQAQVTGTFIGATAFATRGTPFDRGSACDVNKRFLNIRLVWKADANFTHSHLPSGPPDGPRKNLLVIVDQTTGQTCETGAGYRNVGADAGETLLYGHWPSKADG